jgi:ATP-binding cassette subfamily F protein 3
LLNRDSSAGGDGGDGSVSGTAPNGGVKKERRRLAAEQRKAARPLKRKLDRAEDAVHRLEADKARLEQAMAEPELYDGDSAKLIALRKQLGGVAKKLARAEATWLGLQEDWDAARSGAAK